MKTSQSFRIFFTIKKDKEKEGKAPLYAVITINKERCFIALKQVMVDLKNWDFGKGALRGTKEETRELNAYMDEIRLKLGNVYKELQLKGKLITTQSVKSLFLSEKEEVYTLSRLFTYHNETAATDLKWSTLKHYFVTQRYLVKFLETHYRSTDIYLKELNYKFVKDFEVYLRNHKPKDHQKPLNNNGVMKHIIRLKKMVHLALNLQWIDIDPFATYKLKIQKVNRDQLSELELSVMENKEIAIERLNIVRDMFVFCCYTGFCYVDMINLAPSEIVSEINGDRWIRSCRAKTSTPIHVPLLPPALKIIDKYKNNIRAVANRRIFPTISNQKVNCYLKELADICGITKNVTFHVARHTFATTVTLSNGVPIETVSKILGHTKITTTQIYARVVEKKLKEDMDKLKLKLLRAEKIG